MLSNGELELEFRRMERKNSSKLKIVNYNFFSKIIYCKFKIKFKSRIEEFFESKNYNYFSIIKNCQKNIYFS